MRRGNFKLPIPTYREIAVPLLRQILREAGISEEDWDKA
jgi:hypothetical protein